MTKPRGWRAASWPSAATVALMYVLSTMMAGSLPAYAAATSFTANAKIPLSITVLVPCANGGAGELVDLSGSLHDLIHITVGDNGSVHVKLHDNPQGVRGAGETTGAKYQGTGVTQQHFSEGSGGLPFTFTFVNNFRIIGQGPGNNLLVHENTHITVNPHGTVTTSVDKIRITCR